ncbi:hypothetical protein TKK_0016320 [Trichogramma kaykai]|uniref:Helicase ATP-binding domain-containing protein n=1 Tax=Trichogramma kaykai TaxID=54128 RepID=A0ABD2W8C1_9HYME
MSDVQEPSDNEGNSINEENSMNEVTSTNEVTWMDLGLNDIMVKTAMDLNWVKPSLIQQKTIPPAIEGKDIIGLAETGPGKTASFALPVVQSLLENPQRYFALVLNPTRELALQISEQFTAVGAIIGLQCAIVV